MEPDTQLQKYSFLVSAITRVERNDQLISLNRFLFILMESVSREVICQGFVAAHTFLGKLLLFSWTVRLG